MSFGTQRGRPRDLLEGRIAAGAAVTPSRAGRYTLVAHIRLWFRPDATRSPNDLRYLPYSSDVKLPLHANRTDRKYARDRAQELAEQVIQRPGGTASSPIALFSIPSTIARPVWNALLKDPRLSMDLESDIINHASAAGLAVGDRPAL